MMGANYSGAMPQRGIEAMERETSDTRDTRIGNELIEMLCLRVKPNGRVDTTWGDKSPMGLARTVRRMTEPEHASDKAEAHKPDLETNLANLLEGETSVLSPEDARPLARVLVENLPPEYAAAPDLLDALSGLVEWLAANGLDNTGSGGVPPFDYSGTEYSQVTAARLAIDKATP